MSKKTPESMSLHSYVHLMSEKCQEIRAELYYKNLESKQSDDQYSVSCSGLELMPMLVSLFNLHQNGVRGDVIECGTFKGLSAACLSWACDLLGVTLYVADSFKGLPKNATEYYKEGAFCGNFDEVKSNIERVGKPNAVKYIKGFYKESLQGFDSPLKMIWMDVDLKQSVLDAMEHLAPCLNKNGVIFSDGIGPDLINENQKLIPRYDGCEALGFIEFFDEKSKDYYVKYTGVGNVSIIANNEKDVANVYEQLNLEKLLGTQFKKVLDYNKLNETIMYYRELSRKIVIFGAGTQTEALFEHSILSINDIEAIVDSNNYGQEKFGVTIEQPSIISETNYNTFIISSVAFMYEIKEQLIQLVNSEQNEIEIITLDKYYVN